MKATTVAVIVITAAVGLATISLAQQPTTPVRVIDGDTLAMGTDRIRLWGIDAPEALQVCSASNGTEYQCGRDASAVMRELTAHGVSCTAKTRDRYGRTVATCSNASGDIGEQMVRRGWAIDYTRYSAGRYAQAQREAQAERLGLWSGRFTMPEEFRHRR